MCSRQTICFSDLVPKALTEFSAIQVDLQTIKATWQGIERNDDWFKVIGNFSGARRPEEIVCRDPDDCFLPVISPWTNVSIYAFACRHRNITHAVDSVCGPPSQVVYMTTWPTGKKPFSKPLNLLPEPDCLQGVNEFFV